MPNKLLEWKKCINEYYKTYAVKKQKDTKCIKLYQDYVKCNVKCF